MLSLKVRSNWLSLPQAAEKLRLLSGGGGATQGCSRTLTIPKVALMFLTKGAMPHEALWEKWLAGTEGLIPTLCAANAVCARDGLQVCHKPSSQNHPT